MAREGFPAEVVLEPEPRDVQDSLEVLRNSQCVQNHLHLEEAGGGDKPAQAHI